MSQTACCPRVLFPIDETAVTTTTSCESSTTSGLRPLTRQVQVCARGGKSSTLRNTFNEGQRHDSYFTWMMSQQSYQFTLTRTFRESVHGTMSIQFFFFFRNHSITMNLCVITITNKGVIYELFNRLNCLYSYF